MTSLQLPDTPLTMARLDSVSCLLDWIRGMDSDLRQSFLMGLMKGADPQSEVVSNLEIAKKPGVSKPVREQALKTLSDAFFRRDGHSQQADFVRRLHTLIDSKRLSQQELAVRMGCTQPAISQLLERLPHCRPQKRTIHKLAEALAVPPQELWPDLDTAEMLDAVARFQQDDDVMTDAEAAALSAPSKPKARLKPKPLPTRPRQ